MKTISIILSVAGLILIYYHLGIWVSIGVYLFVWGNNIILKNQ
jgi:hypothetical protein